MTYEVFDCFPETITVSTTEDANNYISDAMPNVIAAFRAAGLDAHAGSPVYLYPNIFSGTISSEFELRTFCFALDDKTLIVASFNGKWTNSNSTLSVDRYSTNINAELKLFFTTITIWTNGTTSALHSLTFYSGNSIGGQGTSLGVDNTFRKLIIINGKFIMPVLTNKLTEIYDNNNYWIYIMLYFENSHIICITSKPDVRIDSTPIPYDNSQNIAEYRTYDAITYYYPALQFGITNIYVIQLASNHGQSQGFTIINGEEYYLFGRGTSYVSYTLMIKLI